MQLQVSEELNAIIKYAREEALRTGSYGIGPDHLFLGIIRQEENAAFKALQDLGVEPAELKTFIDRRIFTNETIPNQQAPAEYILQYDPRKTRQYHNLESAKTKGVDLSVRYQINSEWMIGLAYSYLDTDAWLYNTEDERLERVVIDGTAHHKGSWNVTWNKRLSDSYKMGFGLYGRMSSKRYYQLNGDGKGYQIWKLSTSHDITSEKESLLRIEAGIDNIFNYFDDTPHGLHLGTTTPGRTVYATLSIRFNRGKKLKFTSNNSTLKQQNNEEN